MIRTLIVMLLLGGTASAQPAPPGDALQRCLADNTTGKDRKDLARWAFLAMAAHPDMKELISPGAPAALDASSRSTAALMTRLLTEACRTETRAAMASGNPMALQAALNSLGQLALGELMRDRAVGEAMGGLAKYFDNQKFMDALQPR